MLIVITVVLASVELGLKILIAASGFICSPAVTGGPYFLSSKDLGDRERRGFILPSLVFLFYHEHFVLSCECNCG